MDDIERLRASDLAPPELVVSAHLYDVRSGRVSQVISPTPLNSGLCARARRRGQPTEALREE
jgi:hypothetical protein